MPGGKVMIAPMPPIQIWGEHLGDAFSYFLPGESRDVTFYKINPEGSGVPDAHSQPLAGWEVELDEGEMDADAAVNREIKNRYNRLIDYSTILTREDQQTNDLIEVINKWNEFNKKAAADPNYVTAHGGGEGVQELKSCVKTTKKFLAKHPLTAQNIDSQFLDILSSDETVVEFSRQKIAREHIVNGLFGIVNAYGLITLTGRGVARAVTGFVKSTSFAINGFKVLVSSYWNTPTMMGEGLWGAVEGFSDIFENGEAQEQFIAAVTIALTAGVAGRHLLGILQKWKRELGATVRGIDEARPVIKEIYEAVREREQEAQEQEQVEIQRETRDKAIELAREALGERRGEDDDSGERRRSFVEKLLDSAQEYKDELSTLNSTESTSILYWVLHPQRDQSQGVSMINSVLRRAVSTYSDEYRFMQLPGQVEALPVDSLWSRSIEFFKGIKNWATHHLTSNESITLLSKAKSEIAESLHADVSSDIMIQYVAVLAGYKDPTRPGELPDISTSIKHLFTKCMVEVKNPKYHKFLFEILYQLHTGETYERVAQAWESIPVENQQNPENITSAIIGGSPISQPAAAIAQPAARTPAAATAAAQPPTAAAVATAQSTPGRGIIRRWNTDPGPAQIPKPGVSKRARTGIQPGRALPGIVPAEEHEGGGKRRKKSKRKPRKTIRRKTIRRKSNKKRTLRKTNKRTLRKSYRKTIVRKNSKKKSRKLSRK